MVVAFKKQHTISYKKDIFGTEEVWPEMSRNIYDDKVQRQFLFIQNVLEYHKLFLPSYPYHYVYTEIRQIRNHKTTS